MRFKNIAVSFLGLVFALVLPFSSAFADSAGWQLLTDEYVHYNSSLNAYITGVDNAHASGYIQVCNYSGGTRYFLIKEYDPGDNPDESLTGTDKLYQSNGQCLAYNIQNLVDGTNGQAEIYIQTSSSSAEFAIYD